MACFRFAVTIVLAFTTTATFARPPAVPLVTHDPYFSVWSFADELHADWPKHWTGRIHALCGMIRVDGKPYRFMGMLPSNIPTARQTSVRVLPTRTIYTFEAGGVTLDLTFLTPALPRDLDTLALPVTYILCSARAHDGAAHGVQVYLDATAEWAVNDVRQPVTWDRASADNLSVLKIGTVEQPILKKAGDNLRIDWGHLYFAAPAAAGPVPTHRDTAPVAPPPPARSVIAADAAVRNNFARDGSIPNPDDANKPRPAETDWPVLALVQDFGIVKAEPALRRFMIAYDDDFSIEHMGQKLRPWWKRDGVTTIEKVLARADANFDRLHAVCIKFDDQLMADATKAGGPHYAHLCALAFRQTLAAHKLVAAADGKTPLYFSKENFSNGCIATVDVTYPSAPFFLLFNPALLRAQLVPVLDYAASDRWKFPFAPHDLGTYPRANGQVYGGGEKSEADQMPVEECGNMLLLLAALARAENSPALAQQYWPQVSKWAAYLKDKGLDPENQLCTDDFAGHMAHNTNLSLKAVLALGAYAQLCDKLNKKDDATTYNKLAADMAARWQSMANDGDHTRLAFDKPGTWSQKYNLVWDSLLNLNLFPKTLAQNEVAFYKTKLNKFGLPLDNRKTYTKLDWTVWSATLAENDADFRTLIKPTYDWTVATPSRVPMSDWHETTPPGKMSGFQARSVVGGIYIKLLATPDLAKNYTPTPK